MLNRHFKPTVKFLVKSSDIQKIFKSSDIQKIFLVRIHRKCLFIQSAKMQSSRWENFITWDCYRSTRQRVNVIKNVKKWANPGLFFCLFSSFQHVTI